MKIGSDFDKIEFQLFGLDLLEPNGFIGNLLIATFALYYANKIRTFVSNHPFYKNWILFYIIFALTFFSGSLGHLFYNYIGIYGKYLSWYLGIIFPYFAAQAILSIHQNADKRKKLQKYPKIILVLFLLTETLLLLYYGKNITSEKGVLFSSLSSVVGMGMVLSLYAVFYQKRIDSNFKYFWIATLIQIVAGIIQIIKLNIHPWFDRNDLSHLLIVISLIFYYKAIRNLYKNDRFITTV